MGREALRGQGRGVHRLVRPAGYFGRCLPTARTRTTKKAATSSNREPLRLVTLPLAEPGTARLRCRPRPKRGGAHRLALRSLAEQVGCPTRSTRFCSSWTTAPTPPRCALGTSPSPTLLQTSLLNGPGKDPATRGVLGMDVACDRLHAVGRPHALIVTDADTMVASDWISAARAAERRRGRGPYRARGRRHGS